MSFLHQNYNPHTAAFTAATPAAAVTLELLPFFLYNHLFLLHLSFCLLLHGPIISPQTLKSNFIQFIEDASTGQCAGVIT